MLALPTVEELVGKACCLREDTQENETALRNDFMNILSSVSSSAVASFEDSKPDTAADDTASADDQEKQEVAAAELLTKLCQQMFEKLKGVDDCHQQDGSTTKEKSTTANTRTTASIATERMLRLLVDCLWLQSSMMENPSKNRFLVSLVQSVRRATVANLDANGDDDEGSRNNIDAAKKNSSNIAQQQQRILSQTFTNSLLETLDAGLLQAAGVVKSEADVQKKLRMTNTQLYYRQHKFNLLVEESEGYAKWLYGLTTGIRSDRFSDEMGGLREWMRNCQGTFSLDPNRCLDLAVDVLEQQLQRKKNTDMLEPLETTMRVTKNSSDSKYLQRLLIIISALPLDKLPKLLGFKLRGRRDAAAAVANSDGTATAQQPVHSLLQCMAWLTLQPLQQEQKRQGQEADNSDSCEPGSTVLSMADMLLHMPPWLSVMRSAYQSAYKMERQRVQKIGRVSLNTKKSSDSNAEDMQRQQQQEDNEVREPLLLAKNDSSLVLQWIFCFLKRKECWPVVSTALTALDWSKLCFLFPKRVGSVICDWVHDRVKTSMMNMNSANNHGKNASTPTNFLPPWSSVTSEVNKEQELGANTNSESQTLKDLLDEISEPLSYTAGSGCISYRPKLYIDLCRLIKAFLLKEQLSQQDEGHEIQLSDQYTDFLGHFLLPSLSLFHSNPMLCQDMWSLLVLVPYRTRYRLYQSWRGSGLERAGLANKEKPLWLAKGELNAGVAIRYSLKRLSKDTIRDQSRAVAKVCHNHPLVVFTTILSQIESYDNLVEVMVQALKFVTPLSLDVLGFCILTRLSVSDNVASATVNRSRLKPDGVNVSQWLQSLETFTGELYKKYPFVENQGILCYLMHRLSKGHVMELGILRTLLKTSGGWAWQDYAPAASLNQVQLQGRAGSMHLKRETMLFGVVENDAETAIAGEKIRHVLQTQGMGVTLLILLAQVQHQIVFDDSPPDSSSGGANSSRSRLPRPPKPLKLIGNLFDTCKVVMSILLDFLTHSSSSQQDKDSAAAIKMYAKSLPSLAELNTVYRLDLASAWMLCRPLIRAALFAKNKASVPESGSIESGEEELNMSDILSAFTPTESSNKAMLPEKTWKHLTTDLFQDFYSYEVYDIFCPEQSYSSEKIRLEKEADRLTKQLSSSQSNQNTQPAPVTPGVAGSAQKDRLELERVKRAAAALSDDLISQKKHVAATRATMQAKINDYFLSNTVSQVTVTTFLGRCVYPRSMQSPDDAIYCSRFISFLHETNTPGFSTLEFYDALIVALSRSLFGLTEGEAANASILLTETWKVVSKWRYDETSFNEEVAGKPGSFMCKHPLASDDSTKDNEDKESTNNDEAQVQAVPISYKDYQSLYNKWHAAIGATVIGCLGSSEYMHKRNCLIVLTRMVDVYPTRPKLANKFLETLEPLQEENTNALADIRAAAQSYSMQLLKARDDGVWKEEDAATVHARQKKEKAAAAKRQKKAEDMMEEIKRDAQKITDEIGVDSRDRSRGRGGGGWQRSPPPGSVRDSGGRGGPDQPNWERDRQDERRSGRESAPPPSARGGGGGGARDGGRGDDRRLRMRGGPPADSFSAVSSPRTRGGDRGEDGPPPRGLEGRWKRGPGDGPPMQQQSGRAGGKRSRPPSPVEPGESNRDDKRPSKRTRSDTGRYRGRR